MMSSCTGTSTPELQSFIRIRLCKLYNIRCYIIFKKIICLYLYICTKPWYLFIRNVWGIKCKHTAPVATNPAKCAIALLPLFDKSQLLICWVPMMLQGCVNAPVISKGIKRKLVITNIFSLKEKGISIAYTDYKPSFLNKKTIIWYIFNTF